MSDKDLPLISVVVCTRDRPEALARCLDSLDRLDDPRYETIVVDNAREPTVRQASNGSRVVHEPRRGLDFARNRGLSEAGGEIIAFIDDDCEAEPEWLSGLRDAFRAPEVSLATGRVRPGRLAFASHRWFERVSTFDRGGRPRRFEQDGDAPILPGFASQLGTGCNMAFRRDVFDLVGGFDVALDMGTLVGGGGDIDMFFRVLRSGASAVYAPGAIVRHHHRDSLPALARQLFGYSASVGALSAKYASGGQLKLRAALRHQWRWFSWVSRATLLRPRGRRVIGVPLFIVCALGDICGPLAYFASRLRVRRMDASPSS